MAHDAYIYVARCNFCVKTRGGTRKQIKFMKLFLAVGTLDFIAIDLLGYLLKPLGNKRT